MTTDPVNLMTSNPSNPELEQKALQDCVTFIYSKTAQELLIRKIGAFGDAAKNAHEALDALNKINTVATINFPNVQSYINYSGNAQNNALVQNYLWDNRELLLTGFAAISFLIKNNAVTDSPDIIPEQQMKYVNLVADQLRDVIADINTSATIGKKAMLSWFNGLGGTGKEWSVQVNLANAIQQFEFFNTKLQNLLEETMFLFEQFADSASAVLVKVEKIERDIARQIG